MLETYPGEVMRFCPRCGSRSFQAERTDRLRCAACRFPLFINASAAVACLIEDEAGRLLLTERAREPFKGMLDLPGGFVDILETAEAAVAREIREELNLEVTGAVYLFSHPNRYPYEGLTYFTLDLAFRCQVADFAPLRAADDVSGVRFLRRDEIATEEIGGESIRAIVCRYLEMRESLPPCIKTA